MSRINKSFEKLLKVIHEGDQADFIASLLKEKPKDCEKSTNEIHDFQIYKTFIQKVITEIDDIANEIKSDSSVLISVRNQKLLRTSFQLVMSLGISSCLVPGLGVNLAKRCSTAGLLSTNFLTDEQKYDLITECTDFLYRSWEVPVLKNIIISFHLSDYLASLIQLSFAPLKKPGTYNNFTMTQELYDQLLLARQKYLKVYENIVTNSFQPIIMKELLVLQSVVDPPPRKFAKNVIAKELSCRLLAPDGLLSLTRCFIESYNIDTGFEWKKIDMICKIIAVKHGSEPIDCYLKNICLQLKNILTSNNSHYLATAVACVLTLYAKYPQNEPTKLLMDEIFKSFDYESLLKNNNLPGTIIFTTQEIENKINILHACVCTVKLDWSVTLLIPNLFLLFILGVKCTKHEELKLKIKDVIVKCLELLNKKDLYSIMLQFLFGSDDSKPVNIIINETEIGLSVNCTTSQDDYNKHEAMEYFIKVFNSSMDNKFIEIVFESLLQMLVDLNRKRSKNAENHILYSEDDEIVLIDDIDENYANILQLLSEISTSPKIIAALKANPSVVLNFIEHFIMNSKNSKDECITIALVLLNTILSNSNEVENLEERFNILVPVLQEMANRDDNLDSILCKEALSLISCDKTGSSVKDTACERAVKDVFDELLPVRAHGVIALTKLIDAKDEETISKKHYIFCLLQEQLKNSDSYLYLSAVNGIAALGTHCTEDVLQVLCKEFLQMSSEVVVETRDEENKAAELRMKIGDVIVKVTRGLGEMAVNHKTLLLNTMLSGCRDLDPLNRTSALSNLAEIALVLHYKMGTIIYEVLLCIWSIIETDKAVECRRAAVMVISSLLKGLGKETLLQLKENLLPVYRTLKKLYSDPDEDSVVRLHSQIALEELNDTVKQFLFPEVKMERQIFVLDKPPENFK